MTVSVATSTSNLALGLSMNERAYYMADRIWLFYFTGADYRYVTSLDGITFSAPVILWATTATDYVQMWYDGTYLHTVRGRGTNNLLYRRGEPTDTGTITWGADYPIGNGGTDCGVRSICTDSNGNVVVAFYRDQMLMVTMSNNTTGGWNTVAGFPLQANPALSIYNQGCVVPLLDGKWYVAYAGVVGGHVYGKMWTGTALGAQEQVTSIICSAVDRWTLINTGDNLHFAWNAQDNLFNIYYRRRANNVWDAGTEMVDNTTYSSVPALHYNRFTGDIYLFYASGGHVWQRIKSSVDGTWGAAIDLGAEANVVEYYTHTSRYSANGFALVSWVTGTVAPYTIRFLPVGTVFASKMYIQRLKQNSNGSGVGSFLIV